MGENNEEEKEGLKELKIREKELKEKEQQFIERTRTLNQRIQQEAEHLIKSDSKYAQFNDYLQNSSVIHNQYNKLEQEVYNQAKTIENLNKKIKIYQKNVGKETTKTRIGKGNKGNPTDEAQNPPQNPQSQIDDSSGNYCGGSLYTCTQYNQKSDSGTDSKGHSSGYRTNPIDDKTNAIEPSVDPFVIDVSLEEEKDDKTQINESPVENNEDIVNTGRIKGPIQVFKELKSQRASTFATAGMNIIGKYSKHLSGYYRDPSLHGSDAYLTHFLKGIEHSTALPESLDKSEDVAEKGNKPNATPFFNKMDQNVDSTQVEAFGDVSK